MNKVWLIIKREYLTRVTNKTFILSTILLPLFFVGFIAASTYFSIKSQQSYKFAVRDNNGMFQSNFHNDKNITYDFNKDVTPQNFDAKGFDGMVVIPKTIDAPGDSITLISVKQLGIEAEDKIRDQLNGAIKNDAFIKRNIDRNVLDSINGLDTESAYKFSTVVKNGNEVKQSNSGLAYGIGFGCGILIYITLFIYGAAVMRGVMEEKMNRIAELIISSVRPFQLMMGKIFGIAAVGITQLLIWFVLISGIIFIGSSFLSHDMLQNAQTASSSMSSQNSAMAIKLLSAKSTFLQANWALILPCFLFYFIGGYLFYAALFAAVGSVVNEDPQEAQSLMLPITMPIVLSFVIMSTAIGKPDAPISVWGSIIPFSSPIVMMARLPTGTVPIWQLAVSILSLIGGFVITTMLAAKIYRTGILLYGKKVTLKEMSKWLFRKS
ncbi:MAG: ABC transporter permease [Ginsengibacter sp.]